MNSALHFFSSPTPPHHRVCQMIWSKWETCFHYCLDMLCNTFLTQAPLERAPFHVLWGTHQSRIPTCGICGLQNQKKPTRHCTFYFVIGNARYNNVSLLWRGLPDTSLTLKTCSSFSVLAFRNPESFTEVAQP